MKGILITFGIICSIILLGLIGTCVYINYQYERSIGAYFSNAEDCITPECILNQLQTGRQAIVDAGLTEDLYAAWIFKKPDNSMKFQYQHIDAIIDRATAIKDWKDKQYSSEGVGETMKDVYTEKMDNLRKYVTGEGYRSDWIAEHAWWLKNHFFLAMFGLLIGIALFTFPAIWLLWFIIRVLK